MQPDRVRVADTRSWLVRAARDLRAAEYDPGATPSLLDSVVFHSQQAAEKALKAFLTWHDLPFRRTHSLEEIGARAYRIDESLAPLLDRAAVLTEYAWLYRYPGAAEEPPPEEAAAALDTARAVLTEILTRIPPEAQP
jgi:HEPN domain-containing protein